MSNQTKETLIMNLNFEFTLLTDEDVDIFNAVAQRMGVSFVRYDTDSDEADARDARIMLLFAHEQAAPSDIPRPERMHAYAFIGLDYVPPYKELT
jgi:hypothetical protein